MIGGTVQVVRGANRSDAASAPAAFEPRAARTCRLRFYRDAAAARRVAPVANRRGVPAAPTSDVGDGGRARFPHLVGETARPRNPCRHVRL